MRRAVNNTPTYYSALAEEEQRLIKLNRRYLEDCERLKDVDINGYRQLMFDFMTEQECEQERDS